MLIGLIGAKGSGKDTFAKPLVENDWVNLKMAGPLKEMMYTLLDIAGINSDDVDRMIEGDLKEVPSPVLQGKTPRYAMQTLGTEWRNLMGQNLWLDIWKNQVKSARMYGEDIVCTDIRFEHEAKAIRGMDGWLIRIVREGQSSSDTHSSESEMNSIVAHFTVNNRTIEETQALAKSILTTKGETEYAVLSRVLGRDHTDYFPR